MEHLKIRLIAKNILSKTILTVVLEIFSPSIELKLFLYQSMSELETLNLLGTCQQEVRLIFSYFYFIS